MTRIHIGCGAGFAGDRAGPARAVAEELARRDGTRFLIFETLAERTLALAQLASAEARDFGRVEALLRPVLAICLAANIRIVTNIGAADPAAAARRIRDMARAEGLRTPRIAIVTGDDFLAGLDAATLRGLAPDPDIPAGRKILAANVYMGSDPIVRALEAGAEIVVTGRVADPSLVVGPVRHVMGDRADDPALLAAATMAGHLIECAGQVTGGYFADPGYGDIPAPDNLGFPIATINADGEVEISKPPGTGGAVTRAIVLEQLLYEIHDPGAYLTPDVTLDLGAVAIEDRGNDRVRLSGARGLAAPTRLKAVISWDGGWLGEGEISYAGQTAPGRIRMAIDILRRRIDMGDLQDRHFDVIGLDSAFASRDPAVLESRLRKAEHERRSWDLRLRLAVAGLARPAVEWALAELEGLYTNGPAGGGGVRLRLERRIVTSTALVPREMIHPQQEMLS